MQISTSKTKITSTVIIILLMASVALMTMPIQAQEQSHGGQPTTGYEGPTTIPAGETADFTIHPKAFLSVSPNPVGLGQEILVNVWITFPSGEGKYMVGYTVTITKPDETQDTIKLKSYVADGTSWFTYIVDQVGEWKFQFSFAGEWFPAGYYRNGQYSTERTGDFANAIYNPSDYVAPAESPVTTLVVQNDQVMSWHRDLPNDYWTRPIQPNNREWNVIGGNYPWTQAIIAGIDGQCSWDDNWYGPFVTAPNTPHIVWKRQGSLSGIIGGETGTASTRSNPGLPDVIFMGRAYDTRTSFVSNVPTTCASCYDLRTGEIYYAIPTSEGGVTPTYIAYWEGVDTAVPGAGEAASYGAELLTLSGSGNNMRLYKINPFTGAVTVNVSLPNLGTTMFYRNGYYLHFQPVETDYIYPVPDNPSVRTARSRTGFLVNWSVQGSTSNFDSRIVSNISVTIPNSLRTVYQTGSYGALGAYDPETGITVQEDRFIYGGYYGSNFWAVDLVTGRMLWNISTPVTKMESGYRPTNTWNRHGVFVAQMELGYWQARDVRTGKVLWETEMNDYPWGEFWMYDLAAYENLVIGCGYTGVWALDEKTGEVAWHYVDEAPPFEVPYNSADGTIPCYAVQTIRIADGKVYVANSEHTPTQPATRGWGLICLNVTTGEKLWKISGSALSPGPAADGYLTAASSYDGYMYVLGKGKSATTIEAPSTAITLGESLVLRGTVLDQSLAQPGTPCVSSDSMAEWMDYLHLQSPIPTNTKGVSISLDTLDPNSNFVHIGDVTTEGYSGTFGYTWEPEVPGQYQVIATFMGDDSYGSSFATTYITVSEAPPATAAPEPVQIPDYMPMMYAILAVGIIAIIVGLIAIFKKR